MNKRHRKYNGDGTTMSVWAAMSNRGVETRESPSGPNYTDTRSQHYGPANSRGESYINLGELIVQFQFRLSLDDVGDNASAGRYSYFFTGEINSVSESRDATPRSIERVP